MVSFVVLTGEPADVGLRPVLASALVKALRAVRALRAAVVAVALSLVDDWSELPADMLANAEAGAAIGEAIVPIVVAAVTVPPAAFVSAVPGAWPPLRET